MSEARGLSCGDQVDFATGVLHVRRAKSGTPATHPLTGGLAPTTARHGPGDISLGSGFALANAIAIAPLVIYHPVAKGSSSWMRAARGPAVVLRQ